MAKVERNCKGSGEALSSKNVHVMSKLLVLIETKWLICRTGGFALSIHQRDYCDAMNNDIGDYYIFHKEEPVCSTI